MVPEWSSGEPARRGDGRAPFGRGSHGDWAASTYNHYRSLLMYREACRSGKVSANPARDVRHRKETNNRVRFLSRGKNGEYARLVKVLSEQYREHLAESYLA